MQREAVEFNVQNDQIYIVGMIPPKVSIYNLYFNTIVRTAIRKFHKFCHSNE